MEKLRRQFEVSFSTKVIVPVVATMILLIAVTVWMVNTRITHQFQAEAARSLAYAEGSIRTSRNFHIKALFDRFGSIPDQPRYRAVFLHSPGDAPTIKYSLDEMRTNKEEIDIIVYASTQKPQTFVASARRDASLSVPEFEAASSSVIDDCLNREEERADTIQVGFRVFDVVSLPVYGVGRDLIGALTVGSEIVHRTALEMKEATQCEVVLLSHGRVIASTVGRTELHNQFYKIFESCMADSGQTKRPGRVPVGEEHYFCSAGTFPGLSGEGKLGYLLLASYEQPLRSLHLTQQILVGVSALAVLLGAGITWFLVRRVTAPLRALSASAEAVGKGDFSQRVQVKSRDECGELAAVFNQMTENLKRSREQLESTVETLKTTQAQLVQSEKLSGIGEFVAGVAHELNNPLTSVMGFSELLAKADQDPQHKRHLELIYKSAQRCQKIVQNLLSFARRHAPERKLSSINDLVEVAVDFLAYQLRTSNIEVITRLDKYLPKALVDPHQLQQVFLNLINNARQALENHQPRGVIRISTETAGRKVRITVQDNGPGIQEKNLSKVFDPFFTTKEVGKGTGLGLSLCYGIVKEHGGSIVVRSKLGEGAAFTIDLPLADDEGGDDEVEEETTPVQRKLVRKPLGRSRRLEGAGRKVLVIDDEEAILEMVRETLSEQGYEVDVVRDGESALRRVNQKTYDLALCDWKMPGLNGQQVYERLRASHPALSERLIFITGDVINDKAQTFLRETNKVCLSKPFSLVEFRAAIGKALLNS
jgi:signal transduction histidine kinase/CheY-like chemotaxis protein